MPDQIQLDTVHIHRAVILNGLRALYLTQVAGEILLKEESFASGYRQGFEDALRAVACLTGVTADFETNSPSSPPFAIDSRR